MPSNTLLGNLKRADYTYGIVNGSQVNNGSVNGAVLTPDRQFAVIRLQSAGAETRTVSAPTKAGLEFTLNMVTDGGDIVITFPAALNAAGNTIITFNDIGDWARLQSLERGAQTYEWKLIASNGVSLS